MPLSAEKMAAQLSVRVKRDKQALERLRKENGRLRRALQAARGASRARLDTTVVANLGDGERVETTVQITRKGFLVRKYRSPKAWRLGFTAGVEAIVRRAQLDACLARGAARIPGASSHPEAVAQDYCQQEIVHAIYDPPAPEPEPAAPELAEGIAAVAAAPAE
jgi:hypothetical protein